MRGDTICAIATAPGKGGIAIVRCSGPRTRKIMEGVFRPAKERGLTSRCMMYGHAFDEQEEIDEVMAVYFASPNTYTRENMFEIQCHGGGICAHRVLNRCIELGARIAEPGEFTRRAFLNGRIDLSRAEAVMSLIGANSEAAARASLRQLEGGISGFVQILSDRLKECMSLIEACTDFPEEVDECNAVQSVRKAVQEIRSELERHCDPRSARLIREGASIVLVGRPNVGKSSLMNALLQQDRAIVTAVPGTTRDVLTERMRLGEICAEISDTAGQRRTEDPVERIGVERAVRAAELADLVLIVLDASEELTEEDASLLNGVDERTIVCLNKCDLNCRCNYPGALRLSAVSGEGIEDLLRKMEEKLCNFASVEELRMTEDRHLEIARRSMDALKRAQKGLDMQLPLDVVEIELREALGSLSEITGEDASEEVIDRVFQKFCVGK